MAKFRNVDRYARHVPVLSKIVQPDETVDVPEELAAGFACQPTIWKAVESPRNNTKEK